MDGRYIDNIRIALILIFCSFPLLQSCSIDRPVATQAVEFNRSLELSGNEMILLNILRAMNNQPTYFSAVSQVNTSVSNTLGSTLGVTFPIPFTGSGNKDNLVVMPSVAGQTSSGVATATMNSLENDQFTQGMLSPIKPIYVELFEVQGWPERYLLTMIVRKVRIKEDTFTELQSKFPQLSYPNCCINPVTQQRDICREYDVKKDANGNPVIGDGESVAESYVVFYNRPDDDFCEINAFVDLLNIVVGFDFNQITTDAPYGEPFTVAGNSQLADIIIKAKQQNLNLKQLKSNKYVFTEQSTKWKTEVRLKSDQNAVLLQGLVDAQGVVERSATQSQHGDVFVSADDRIEVYLKTPQQVFIYLGHIIGVQLANNNSYGNLAKTYWENEQKPIFVVHESDEEPIDAVVKVEYNDKWYSIPHSDQLNRTEISTSTLTFVKQVMGLNTSKEAVGSSTSVVTGVVVQ